MKVVFAGYLWYGSTSLQRLSALRNIFNHDEMSAVDLTSCYSNWVIKLVEKISEKLRLYIDFNGSNKQIINCFKQGDTIKMLWIEKGLQIRMSTLQYIKKNSPHTTIVFYHPDDILNPVNQSFKFIKSLALYDAIITTKSYNVPELISLGVRKAIFVENAFDPMIHYPRNLSEEERGEFKTSVNFIGSWEQDRFEKILFLVNNGISVNVWGRDWKKYQGHYENMHIVPYNFWGEAYAKVLSAADINLCFLKKGNRDLQTTRSIEIPACGSFMLAERTSEHAALFKEGVEAEFFSDEVELLSKVKYYLLNVKQRKEIAIAGYARCLESDYSYEGRIRKIITSLLE